MSAAPLARLVSIPELAARKRVHRATMWRQLLALHAADLCDRPELAGWLVRHRKGGPARINESMLRKAHPEWFEEPTAASLQDQIDEVREHAHFTRARVNALAAAFREHRKEHER